jgi:hypothetical protein
MSREFKLNTTAFMETAARFLANSKRDALVVMKQQAKGVIKEVISLTPPGGPGVSSGQARTRGTKNVKADALKVVKGVSPKRAEQQDVASIIESKRVRGRIRKEVIPRILVPMDKLKAYLKAKQQHVGKLASGWNEAAAKLGLKPPAWIWRNDGPGMMDISVTDKDITIRATNAVPYASEMSKLRSRLQQALHLQRNKMNRQLKDFMAKAAKKAGFK